MYGEFFRSLRVFFAQKRKLNDDFRIQELRNRKLEEVPFG